MKKPIYIKWSMRDFCLPFIETWSRAETTDPRQWTNKQQPYQPYIILIRRNGFVTNYTDPSGEKWVKQELRHFIDRDPHFVRKAVNEFYKRVKPIQPIWEKQKTIDRKTLADYIAHWRDGWAWFEAVWWIMDMSDPESEAFRLTSHARTVTENMMPYSDILIKKSLRHIYPKLGEYAENLIIEEIAENRPPSLKEAKARKKSYAYANATLFTGQGIEEMEQRFNVHIERAPKTDPDLKEFRGQVAYRGIVRGKVRRILSRADVPSVQKGEILICPMTMPDYLPAMIKAVAFVTDEGGITCHAAIVAREFKKPCIIGTKIATQILKTGDFVEVDANNGIVRLRNKATANK